ncbi:MAG: hypothetical protein ACWGNB_05005 [Thiogranum sp.]
MGVVDVKSEHRRKNQPCRPVNFVAKLDEPLVRRDPMKNEVAEDKKFGHQLK